MAASTGPREANRQQGAVLAYPVGANTNINKDTLVVTRNDGYAYPARAGAGATADIFLGVAYETINNAPGATNPNTTNTNLGAAGAISIRVWKEGVFTFAFPGATQALVGQKVYASDDQTLTTSATNGTNPNTLVGYVVSLVNANSVRIKIDNVVN